MGEQAEGLAAKGLTPGALPAEAPAAAVVRFTYHNHRIHRCTNMIAVDAADVRKFDRPEDLLNVLQVSRPF